MPILQVIAAAGKESDRNRGVVRPVAHPANCPSIMAVAAIDRNLAVASFSNAGLTLSGGQIDIAALGVDIYSSC
jgi:subtilisin family serine protease